MSNISDIPQLGILLRVLSLQMGAFDIAIKTHHPETYATYLDHFQKAKDADTQLGVLQQMMEMAKDLDIASRLPMPEEGQS